MTTKAVIGRLCLPQSLAITKQRFAFTVDVVARLLTAPSETEFVDNNSQAGLSRSRFYRGDIYQAVNAPQKALVVVVSDRGQMATLRLFDGEREFCAVWTEFDQTGRWKLFKDEY